MKAGELVKLWGLPDRSAERVQITLRLPYPDYTRLHALKKVYPNRSVNDMISDLVKVGLDEVVEVLPTYEYPSVDHAALDARAEGVSDEDFEEFLTRGYGPRVQFDDALQEILSQKSTDDGDLVAQLVSEDGR